MQGHSLKCNLKCNAIGRNYGRTLEIEVRKNVAGRDPDLMMKTAYLAASRYNNAAVYLQK